MSENEEQRDDEATGEAAGQKKLSDDPLSLVLIGAAILLAVVYFWEQNSRETIEEQMAVAESIHANFAIDSARCTIGSAGAGGRVLVFACTGVSPDAVATAAADSDAVTNAVDAFEEVHFRSADAALNCPPDPGGWPGDCTVFGAGGGAAHEVDDDHQHDHEHEESR